MWMTCFFPVSAFLPDSVGSFAPCLYSGNQGTPAWSGVFIHAGFVPQTYFIRPCEGSLGKGSEK